MPNHHVPDELIALVAAGRADPGLALLVACHEVSCPTCLATRARHEALGGALLAGLAPSAIGPGLLASTLAALDDAPTPAAPEPLTPPDAPWLPRPLWRHVQGGVPWRRLTPEVEFAELPVRFGDQPAVLTRIAPGARVPWHTHRGWELQLVITGGYHDDGTPFVPGDAQCLDDQTTHRFTIDPGETCVSLLVRESRFVPRSPRALLFGWWTGA